MVRWNENLIGKIFSEIFNSVKQIKEKNKFKKVILRSKKIDKEVNAKKEKSNKLIDEQMSFVITKKKTLRFVVTSF